MIVENFVRGMKFASSLVNNDVADHIRFYNFQGIECTFEEGKDHEICGASFFIDPETKEEVIAVTCYV